MDKCVVCGMRIAVAPYINAACCAGACFEWLTLPAWWKEWLRRIPVPDAR
jgi:hypothetical protein